MDTFPADAAEDLKECAMAAGNSAAHERLGKRFGAADAEKVHWNRHGDSFKKKMDGFLSAKTCDNIKSMFWHQGKETLPDPLDEMRREILRSEGDSINVEGPILSHGYFEKILGRGELTEELATNMNAMGWFIMSYCANTKHGQKDDAVRVKAKYEDCYREISGEINLVAMNFHTDTAKTLSQKPKVVTEQRLANNSDVEQSMEFDFAVTKGTTHSTSHQIGFKYGIKAGFSAGFFGFADAKFEASFEFSHNHTWSDSISKGTTKTYKFPLRVPAKKAYIAKGMVQEAEMEVPYDLVLDFGGTQKTVSGIWKGVAVSTASYEINSA